MLNEEIFEPYEKLIEIEILGRTINVPENNSILRSLQFVEMESVSYGDFCWNGECLNCRVTIRNDDKEKDVMACRTDVKHGMSIISVSSEIADVLDEIS